MDINALKDSFIKFYYQLYDGNRSELKNLYAENSMITMNGSNASGSSQIVAQLQTLPKTQHNILTTDAHTVPSNDGALVLVTGQIQLENNTKFSFSEYFNIQKSASGSYFVFNQVFRVVG